MVFELQHSNDRASSPSSQRPSLLAFWVSQAAWQLPLWIPLDAYRRLGQQPEQLKLSFCFSVPFSWRSLCASFLFGFT